MYSRASAFQRGESMTTSFLVMRACTRFPCKKALASVHPNIKMLHSLALGLMAHQLQDLYAPMETSATRH